VCFPSCWKHPSTVQAMVASTMRYTSLLNPLSCHPLRRFPECSPFYRDWEEGALRAPPGAFGALPSKGFSEPGTWRTSSLGPARGPMLSQDTGKTACPSRSPHSRQELQSWGRSNTLLWDSRSFEEACRHVASDAFQVKNVIGRLGCGFFTMA
jgi:hypothetical protein